MDPAFARFRQLALNEPPIPAPAPLVEADIHRPVCIRYKAHVFGNDEICIYCRRHRDLG